MRVNVCWTAYLSRPRLGFPLVSNALARKKSKSCFRAWILFKKYFRINKYATLSMKHLFKLRRFYQPYLLQLIFNMLILLSMTGLSFVVPQIIQGVIDKGLKAGATAFLVRSALLLVGIGAGTAVLNLGQRYLTEWIGAHVGYDLRNAMYDRIQYLPFTYHDHSTTGQLITRCIEDVRA